MLQSINKKKIYFYFLVFTFLSTISNLNFFKNFIQIFVVDNYEITNTSEEIKNIILDKIKKKNINILFFKDKQKVKSVIDEIKIFDYVEVKKIYPSKLLFNLKNAEILGVTFLNGKKYYIGSNHKLISANEYPIDMSSPVIFGNFEIVDFIKLLTLLKENNINVKNINKYFYHQNRRWDLFFKNNIILMLPSKNLNNAINIYKKFENNNNINENSKIDLRIQNRLILSSD